MVLYMICNYKKCRKTLPATAWVTNCSHAFCEEHGDQHFSQRSLEALVCPACNTQLKDKFDVVQADLNPPEGFKSIVLAGMSPDVIMDVAMRAMSFWSYQLQEETKHQESIGKHFKEKANSLAQIHSLSIHKLKTEMQSHINKVEELLTEQNNQKQFIEEISFKLEERNRKIQKLQHQLNCQKRDSISINEIQDYKINNPHSLSELIAHRSNKERSDFTFQPQMKKNKNDSQSSDETPQNEFVFRPVLK